MWCFRFFFSVARGCTELQAVVQVSCGYQISETAVARGCTAGPYPKHGPHIVARNTML